MGRLWGVGMTVALAAALSLSAYAAAPGQRSLGAASDFTRSFALRFFGETGDTAATQNAAFGDPGSESLLRDFALRVTFIARPDHSSLRVLPYAATIAQPLPQPALLAAEAFRSPSFAPPQTFSTDFTTATPPTVTAFAPTYAPTSTPAYRPPTQGVSQSAATPTIGTFAPQSAAGSGAVTTFSQQITLSNGFNAGADAPGSAAAFTQTGANVSLPVAVDVGKVHLRGHVEGAQAQATSLALQTRSMGAGADATIHALQRDVHVNVGSSYEHLTRNDALPLASNGFDSTSTLQLAPNGLVPIPAYADLSKRTVSAGVAVPITRNVTVGAQYDQQRLLGGYGVQGAANVDARNDIYGGNVTFRLPSNPSASISLSAKQYRFQDNLVPANAFTQTRADLNFTVKFK